MSSMKKSIALSLMVSTTLWMAACGKKPSADSQSTSSPSAPVSGETTGAAPAASTTGGTTAPAPSAPTAGSGGIKGKINFSGTAPEMADLDRAGDEFCAKTPMKDQEVVVNGNKTLKNVAVRLIGAQGGSPAKVVVDQKNCMYEPRMQVALSNQDVDIHNSDPTLHNVHTYDKTGDKTFFNQAQPKGAPSMTKKFDVKEGEIVKFKCDVHPWMTGWLVLSENAFSAVSNDNGEFEIKGVPAGKYKLKAFQERFGEKEIEVTVEADKVAEANFEYKGDETADYKFREVNISMNHSHHAK